MGSAIGSIAGAIIGGNATKKAASTQAKASRDATAAQERITQKQIDLQREMFNKQVDLQAPFRENGLNANNRLSALLGLPSTSLNQGDDRIGSLMRAFSPQDFQGDPGYQFRMSEGMKGVENSAAARGGALSGAALKAIQKYGQDFASNEYTNAYNRFNSDQTNQFNRLTSLAGGGQTASNQIGNAAGNFANGAAGAYQNLGNAQASNILGAGNARSAGQIGTANAWSRGLSGLGNAFDDAGGFAGIGSFFGSSPNTSDYRGSTLPDSLRGSNNY